MVGRRVALIRSEHQAQLFIKKLFDIKEIDKPYLSNIDQFMSENFIFSPVLHIEPCHATWPQDDIDALIVTSMNALSHVEIPNRLMKKDVYVVGNETAQQILSTGVLHIKKIFLTVSDLIDYLRNMNPDLSKMLYVRGRHIRQNLRQALGKDLQEIVSYDAKPARYFTEEFLIALNKKDVGLIPFFSQRSAALFCELAVRHQMQAELENIHAVCLHKDMAPILNPFFGGNLSVCDTPESASMIKNVHKFLVQGTT